jgi:uncharacterized membrane protein YcaP (DUF421 family)
MFVMQIPVVEKLLRTVLVYALVAALIRLTGKRGLAGLNTLDIAVVFLLSNVVQNAIIGDDLSVWGGAVGAVTLVVVNAALNRLALHSQVFGRLFDGTDTTLIDDGNKLAGNMRHVGVRDGELDHALRIQNGDDPAEVQSAVLDASGHLVVTLKPEEQNATKGDVQRLGDRLARIEAALTASGSQTRQRSGPPGAGS